jgi:hypothetical protein
LTRLGDQTHEPPQSRHATLTITSLINRYVNYGLVSSNLWSCFRYHYIDIIPSPWDETWGVEFSCVLNRIISVAGARSLEERGGGLWWNPVVMCVGAPHCWKNCDTESCGQWDAEMHDLMNLTMNNQTILFPQNNNLAFYHSPFKTINVSTSNFTAPLYSYPRHHQDTHTTGPNQLNRSTYRYITTQQTYIY